MLHAKDIMSCDVKTVSYDTPVVELEDLFVKFDVSGFPVLKDGTLVGVISVSDLVRELSEIHHFAETSSGYYRDEPDPDRLSNVAANALYAGVASNLRAGDLMNRDLVTVPPTEPIKSVAATMAQKKIHRVLVVEGDQLLGVVTSMDITRVCGERENDIVFSPPETLDF